MRKFKNRFVAVMAAAITGVMTFGLTSAACPVTAVFAQQGDFIIAAAGTTEATAGRETMITLSAGTENESGEIGTEDTGAAFAIVGTYEGASISGKVLTIGSTAAAGTITVTATSSTDASITAQLTITIKPAEDPGETAETKVDIAYDTFTATITGDADAKYAFLEVWKFGTKGATNFDETTSSKDKLSNTYSYEMTNGTVTVDLSFLKATTVQGIKVFTDKNTEKVKKVVAAQPGKLSGLKYNSATKTFDISKAKEGGTALTAETFKETLYEYRGQYGAKWTPLEELATTDHISAGSTIIIRKKAVPETTPAGPEAKVKIAAAAKAPKISVDYVKGTVKFSDKMKYAGNGQDYKAGTKDPMTLENLRSTLGNASADAELVVFARTAGDSSKGKPDSNVACVVIPAEVKMTDADGTITVDGSADDKVVYKKSTAGSGTKAKEVYEFSVSGDAFEFSTVAPAKDADRKWKKITSSKPFTVELTDKEQTVYVRRAGKKGKAKDGSDSYFPSAEIPVTVPAKSTPSKIKEVNVTSPATVTLAADGNATTLPLTATVTPNDGVTLTDDEKLVTWTVKSALKSDGTTDIKENVSIAAGDVLTIAADSADAGTVIVVTATSKADTSKTVDFEITVTAAK